MLWVLFSVAIVIAVYFATRFFLLKKAMKEANREFQDILKRYTAESDPHMRCRIKELEKYGAICQSGIGNRFRNRASGV